MSHMTAAKTTTPYMINEDHIRYAHEDIILIPHHSSRDALLQARSDWEDMKTEYSDLESRCEMYESHSLEQAKYIEYMEEVVNSSEETIRLQRDEAITMKRSFIQSLSFKDDRIRDMEKTIAELQRELQCMKDNTTKGQALTMDDLTTSIG